MSAAHPLYRRHGVDHRGAVELCAEWLAYLGESDVVIAPDDAPYDLSSSGCIAWATSKHGNVEVDYVADAIECAQSDVRLPVVFFEGGFDPDAQDLATAAGFALLHFISGSARLYGLNPRGRAFYGDRK